MTLGLRVCPRASREGSDRLTEGQVDALDERGLDEGAESRLTQTRKELLAFAPQHARMGEGDVTFAFTFDELTIVQVSARLPVVSTGFRWAKPCAKVSGEGVEVTAQSVGGGCGDASG